MPDLLFSHPRLAAIYDELDGERTDLEAYLAIALELGAHSVLDIGCGTGNLALLLAGHGLQVTGVDPAGTSLEIARAKPGADQVRWLEGPARTALPLEVDLVTMTGNVAQVFLSDEEWAEVLEVSRSALGEGGHLVFETRQPQRRAWEAWSGAVARLDLPDGGRVEVTREVTEVALPYVSFETRFTFSSDGAVLVSVSRLRFRGREELVGTLRAAGFALREVREAPDRPGLELVFLAGPS